MSPAERRLTELIDKWLASIDAHCAYLELDEKQYWEARAWPKHERPSRWVLDVARQKLLELKTFCENRQAMGDTRFAEGMELVVFLANLVGLQNIQRYIPLVDGPVELKPTEAAAPAPPAPAPPARSAPAPNGRDTKIETPQPRAAAPPAPLAPETKVRAPAPLHSGDETTREMPQIPATLAPKPGPVQYPQFPTRPVPRGDSRKPTKSTDKQPPPLKDAVSPELQNKIMSDAVRLMKWGKQWHELPDLIARLADRPPAAVIRRLLRTQKTQIEAKLAAQ